MTLEGETKIYVVQIQARRYYDPAAPWDTVMVTHDHDEAVECADGNAGHGMQARVLRYDVQCRVLRLHRLTQYAEERAKEVADAIARKNAADAQRDGIEEACDAHSLCY